MNTKKSKILTLIIMLCILAVVLVINLFTYVINTNKNTSTTLDTSFTIVNYTFDADLHEDNTIDVSEVITVNFLKSGKHGIYRNIPLVQELKLDDQSKPITQKINISNIRANQSAEKSFDNGNVIIRFGSENSVQPTDRNIDFTLSYTLDLGKDYTEDYDMFYFNLVGSDWDVEIQSFTFNVSFPKDFDANLLNMYSGKLGSANQFTNYNISNNVISGTATNLGANEALTISLKLPENYFSTAKTITSSFAKVSMWVAVSVLILIVLFFAFRTRKTPLVCPVEFYAPDGMNPIDVGSIHNDNVTTSDITSLIIYFASKKYLKININENKEIILTKLKDISPKAKDYEKKLFNRLFEESNEINLTTDIKEKTTKDKTVNSDIESKELESIPMTIFNCTIEARQKRPVKNRFNPKNLTFGAIGTLLLLISVIMFVCGYVEDIYSLKSGFIGLFLVPFVTLFISCINLNLHNHRLTKSQTILNIVVIVLSVSNIAIDLIYGFASISYTMGYIHWVVGIASLISVVLVGNIFIYSKEQTKAMGRVLGFKNFILTCEKDRMDVLLKDNPEYFYDILPYAYVFGITDQFVRRFEYLGYIPPKNTCFENIGDYIIFNSIVNRNFDKISKYAINEHVGTINSDSGRGFSGGGFSGGGFSGGGGGSW